MNNENASKRGYAQNTRKAEIDRNGAVPCDLTTRLAKARHGIEPAGTTVRTATELIRPTPPKLGRRHAEDDRRLVGGTTEAATFCNARRAYRTKRSEALEMWRSLFVALGISSVILGVECLVIDKAVLARREDPAPGILNKEGKVATVGRSRELIPPDWAPWSLMSTGAVVVLYSFTLPRKV